LAQKWNIDSWENDKKSIYGYDANNNQTSEIIQEWNDSSWVNTDHYTQLFDDNNNPLSFTSKMWNSEGTKVIEGDSIRIYFQTSTGMQGIPEAGVSIYPNPAKGKVAIRANTQINSVEIYNLQGKRIYTDYSFNMQSSKQIDLTGYSKGVYILKAINEAKIYTRKVIIQ
jgi:hypothetical protein